jgi:hypothetical protein
MLVWMPSGLLRKLLPTLVVLGALIAVANRSCSSGKTQLEPEEAFALTFSQDREKAEKGRQTLLKNPAQSVPYLVQELANPETLPKDAVYARFQRYGIFRSYIPSYRRRDKAVQLIAAIGPAASNAVPHLIRAVQNGDEPKLELFVALGAVAPEPSVVIPILMEGLNNSDKMARAHAATGLAYFGARSKVAVPTLQRLYRDSQGQLENEYFRDALLAIDPRAADEVGAGNNVSE